MNIETNNSEDMKNAIIDLEKENIKTGKFTTQDIVKAIRRIIEKIAD